MVSDSELVDRLLEVLRTSDLNTTTAGSVRRTLESEFGVDLSDRKSFIRDQIDSFLKSEVDGDPQNDVVEERVDEEVPQTVKPNDDSGSEEDDSEEEEESESEKPKSDKVGNAVKKKGGGFTKPCALSPQLQNVVGVSELARPEVVKKLWAYIREKNLQDPKNRKKILCDEALRALFRVNSINMFQMNKVLSKHIWSLNEEVLVKSSPKEKLHKQSREVPVKSSQKEKRKERREGSNEQKVKRQKGKASGLLAPLPLSDALVKFFGTGEIELSRADVVKKMWQYIKQNDLQDPSDRRRIICDEKLKELFEVDSFNGFTVSKLLTSHFIKAEQ